MKNVNVKNFLADQIRTSAMEIIKTDEIESLIENGLLTHPNEYFDIVQECRVKLRHTDNERSKRVIEVKVDGSKVEKKTVSRNPHPWHGSPDPTQHSYLKLPTKVSDE